MAAINQIALRTPLASIASGPHLRVYQLANDGGVREALYESSWTGGVAPANVIGSVKPTSPLSATATPSLTNVRVYGLETDSTLKELAFDIGKGWYVGGLSGSKFGVAPYSSVAGVYLANDPNRLRVYAQLADDTIQEFSYDGDGKGWWKDQNLGPALPGTSIAAVSWGNAVSQIGIRVYFQDKSLNVIEKCHDPTSVWYAGALKFALPVPRASLAAVTYGGLGGNIRVYYGAADGKVREKAFDAGKGWYDGAFAQASVPASRLAALTVGANDLRVYLQNGVSVTGVSEFGFIGGSWVQTQGALPPA